MQKFEDINIPFALEMIARQKICRANPNPQSIIQECRDSHNSYFSEIAAMDGPKPTILWYAHDHGTQFFTEREAFIVNTSANISWLTPLRYHEDVFAYAIDVKEICNGCIMGDIYFLDYLMHAEYVQDHAIATLKTLKVDGDAGVGLEPYLSEEDTFRLEQELVEQHYDRQSIEESASFSRHQNYLDDTTVIDEAGRIMAELQALDKPNSPHKTHYMVQINSTIRDHDRLMHLISYPEIHLTPLNGLEGIYITVPQKYKEQWDIKRKSAENLNTIKAKILAGQHKLERLWQEYTSTDDPFMGDGASPEPDSYEVNGGRYTEVSQEQRENRRDRDEATEIPMLDYLDEVNDEQER